MAETGLQPASDSHLAALSINLVLSPHLYQVCESVFARNVINFPWKPPEEGFVSFPSLWWLDFSHSLFLSYTLESALKQRFQNRHY